MRRFLFATALASSLGLVASANAQDASPVDVLEGSPALAGASADVAGKLEVRPISALQQELTFELSERNGGNQITSFEDSHTQQLHVIAVSSDLSEFVHEHVESASEDGRLRANVAFPEPGSYHVYADVEPEGFGKQVLRFEVQVGVDGAAAPLAERSLSATPSAVEAGPYTVQIDISSLRAGQSGEMSLSILRDGKPATDLEPYLGAGAHVVLVAADDLSYVHVHPEAQGGNATDGSHSDGHGASNVSASAQPSMNHSGHDAHWAAAEDRQQSANAAVPNEMSLHVEPPQPGPYAMWIEFNGGGELRTAPFVIDVPS